MRGHFSLKHDPYLDIVNFGNLVGDDAYAFAVAHFPYYENAGRLIAHDVVEHSLKHRRSKHIRIEEELRALGAVLFVRALDITHDVIGNLYYLKRPIDKVPYTMRRYIDDNLGMVIEYDEMAEMYENECDDHLAKWLWADVNYHIRWGQLLKEWQFDGDQQAAWNAFRFIERESLDVLKHIHHEGSYGASIYFDTERGIFRWRYRRM